MKKLAILFSLTARIKAGPPDVRGIDPSAPRTCYFEYLNSVGVCVSGGKAYQCVQRHDSESWSIDCGVFSATNPLAVERL